MRWPWTVTLLASNMAANDEIPPTVTETPLPCTISLSFYCCLDKTEQMLTFASVYLFLFLAACVTCQRSDRATYNVTTRLCLIFSSKVIFTNVHVVLLLN